MAGDAAQPGEWGNMANKFKGTVDVEIAGKPYALGMTIGAMGELATALNCETVDDLNKRLGNLRLQDLCAIISALCRGNGHDVAEAEIKRLSFDEGIQIVNRVMTAGASDEKSARPQKAARPAA